LYAVFSKQTVVESCYVTINGESRCSEMGVQSS
jgi:hypothetical protein